MAGEAPIEHDVRWPVVSLSEITTKIGSGATPKGGADAYLPVRQCFALVRSQNVFDRRFDQTGLAFITDEQAEGLRGVILEPGDVLLNITGDGITFGRACMVPANVLPACVNQHVSIIRVDPRHAEPGYVLAFLTHPAVKLYIESFNAGGSRRAVTKGHIESFRLPLPPLPAQRAIAHILGTLDDKIEMNRRMSETLEAMARALFKSWFVDFDPVRAKAEGRDPGLPPDVAALFPDRLVETEDGEIPEGWKVWRLEEIARQHRASLSPSAEPERVFEHYSIPAHDNGQEPALDHGETIKSNKTIVPDEAVLLSKLNPEISRVWLPKIASEYAQVASTEFLCFTAQPPAGRAAIYCLFRSKSFRRELEAMVTGTSKSHQRVSPTALLQRPVCAGYGKIFEAFERQAWPLLERTISCRAGSRTLAALRDTLLPKLISGDLRVKDAERFVREATA